MSTLRAGTLYLRFAACPRHPVRSPSPELSTGINIRGWGGEGRVEGFLLQIFVPENRLYFSSLSMQKVGQKLFIGLVCASASDRCCQLFTQPGIYHLTLLIRTIITAIKSVSVRGWQDW